MGIPSNEFGGQEPGTSEEIRQQLTTIHDVTFPILDKTELNGPNACELAKFLRVNTWALQDIAGIKTVAWSWSKWLVDENGHVVAYHELHEDPSTFENEICEMLD